LAKFRFLHSQFNAHSERRIQKGRRESEKRNKRLGWRSFRRVPCCLSLRLKLWVETLNNLDFQVVHWRQFYWCLNMVGHVLKEFEFLFRNLRVL
jgi:hypothetical protein